ncbi:MAG: twin-arginine translocation signal domain-containing protein, partial [Casimicrobiaceae bacterium]
MLLTRKSESAHSAAPRLRRLAAPAATFDRRTFLKRSGMVAGAGAFATQLPLGSIGKAKAADEANAVKR